MFGKKKRESVAAVFKLYLLHHFNKGLNIANQNLVHGVALEKLSIQNYKRLVLDIEFKYTQNPLQILDLHQIFVVCYQTYTTLTIM